MIIDVIFVLLILIALFKGLRKGLVVALFSFLGIFVALAAALKLSAVVAAHLKNAVNISNRWLPVISFILVFIVLVILVRWVAKMLETALDFAMVGWLNKLGGILLYATLYTIIFSVFLFYAVKLNIIKEEVITRSETYPYLQPWGPVAINWFARIIPFFKDMFRDLELFFDHISRNLAIDI